jgi:RHS repeat-associated protein
LNRLTTKTPDPFFAAPAVQFTYTFTSRRNSMSDASGPTSYSYNSMDRLITKNTPQGALQYQYDAAGNLTRISVSGATPVTADYAYDALNRLATATATYGATPGGATSYSYDPVGNLAAVTQPNGVVHAYTYDNRNRLANLAVNAGGGAGPALASYAYTLAPTGHRLSVAELSGRTVTYAYDPIYRLTSETIAGDTATPTPQNGAISYTYDAVGNRTQLASTVPAIPAGLWNYDANDRFTGATADTYDANGNTISSGGISATYDFENRLITKGGVTITYNGDGQRVRKFVAGVTTNFLVDDLNPTGHEQVILEAVVGQNAARPYVYGLDLISQRRQTGSTTFVTSFYGYDGHGSVRFLTDSVGTATDTYDYDAFGNLISSTGSTPNHYRYAGEQFDADLNLYYNRARYLDVRIGRFWTVDSHEGNLTDPGTLHRYLYAANDPTNQIDPSGLFTLAEINVAGGIHQKLSADDAKAKEAARQAITKARVFDIYSCSRLQRPPVPIHCWVYANFPGDQGLRYDVGAEELSMNLLKGPVPGFLAITSTSLEAVKRDANFSFSKVASLTFPSLLKWQAGVIAGATFVRLAQEGADEFLFSLPYNLTNGLIGEGLNCIGFTFAAVAFAKKLEKTQ